MTILNSENVLRLLKYIDPQGDRVTYQNMYGKQARPKSKRYILGSIYVYGDYHITVGHYTFLQRDYYPAQEILLERGVIREMVAGDHFIIGYEVCIDYRTIFKHRVFIRTTKEQAEEEFMKLLLCI